MTMLPFKLSIQPPRSSSCSPSAAPWPRPISKAGRKAHNMAAGSDQGVAVARSFGDLSHAVFVPVEPDGVRRRRTAHHRLLEQRRGTRTFFADRAGPAGRHAALSATARAWSGRRRPACRASACRRRSAGTIAMSASPAARSLRAKAAEKILTEALRKRRQHRPRQGSDVARMVLPPRARPAKSRRSKRSASTSGSMPTACTRSMPTRRRWTASPACSPARRRPRSGRSRRARGWSGKPEKTQA